MNPRRFLKPLYFAIIVAAVAFFSETSFADSIPVSVGGGSFADQGPAASISGPGVSINFNNYDGNPLQFSCVTSPCTAIVPIAPYHQLGAQRIDATGCVYDQCSDWVTGSLTLTIDSFAFSDSPGSFTFSTTGTISGTLYGGPVPPGYYGVDYSQFPNGNFSLSVTGPVNVTLYGVVSGGSFIDETVSFTTDHSLDANVTVVSEPSTALFLGTGLLAIVAAVAVSATKQAGITTKGAEVLVPHDPS